MACLVLTRPVGDDGDVAAFERAGMTVRRLPLIRLLSASDPAAARAALAGLASCDLAVPVSPAAVRATLDLLGGAWPPRCAVAFVGPGSRAAFERGLSGRGQDPAGLTLLAPPADAADSEGLWRVLSAHRDWAGARVLLLRGQSGREWLAERLREAGAEVGSISVYRREAPVPDAPTLGALRGCVDDGCIWLFTAAEAARNLGPLLHAAGLAPDVLATRRAVATHPRVAAAARDAGFGRVDVCEPGAARVIAALGQD